MHLPPNHFTPLVRTAQQADIDHFERFSNRMRPLFAIIFLFFLTASGCSTLQQSRLDYYFPEKTKYVEGIYRKFYNEKIISKTNPYPENEKLCNLRRAYRGDLSSLRAFFNSPDANANGEPGEAWTYDCFFLLISVGDDVFSSALAQEPVAIREGVGMSIDPHCNWEKDSFPKTRALYKYRFQSDKPYSKP